MLNIAKIYPQTFSLDNLFVKVNYKNDLKNKIQLNKLIIDKTIFAPNE